MPPILWLLAGGLLLTAGDIVFKYELLAPSRPLYAAGLAIYLVALVCLTRSFRGENIAVASAMLVIFNIVSLSLVSWLCFHEPLSPRQLAGIALASGAVVLLH